METVKLQKTVESLSLELDAAAKLATVNECIKNAVLQNQLLLSMKEKSALERESSLNNFQAKNLARKREPTKAKQDSNDTIEKLNIHACNSNRICKVWRRSSLT